MNTDDKSSPKPAIQRPETPEFWDHRFKQGVMPWDAGADGLQVAFVDFARRFRTEYSQTMQPRVLIPGCGSAYEAVLLANENWDVTALDFSAVAIAAAQKIVGENWPGTLLEADFFTYQPEQAFDVIYERAFLCALPRKLWADYPQQMASLLKPGGILAGFFFLSNELEYFHVESAQGVDAKDRPPGTASGCNAERVQLGNALKGPPFASTQQGLNDLLTPYFECLEDKVVTDSIGLFAGQERWQIWRKRG